MIGYDPKSMGLLKYDRVNTDPKYTAVSTSAGVTLYALHPKYLNPDDIDFLRTVFSPTPEARLETRVYAKSVTMRGFLQHNQYNMYSMPAGLIKIINNPFSGNSPFDYAQDLKDQLPDGGVFAPFYLTYGTTIDPVDIDLLTLPNIDLNADADITVSIGDVTRTVPLAWLLNPDLMSDSHLRVLPGEQTGDGFFFSGSVGGSEFWSQYTRSFTQSAVISGYVNHMLQNKNREVGLTTSQLYNGAVSAVAAFSGDDYSKFGGVNSVLTMLLQFYLREAMYDDLRNQELNVGGNIIENPIGHTLDNLINISYPIKKITRLQGGSVYLGDLQPNATRTFELNSVYDSMAEFITAAKDMYKGDIVGADVVPVVSYGNYTQYFQQIISRGGLL